MEPWWNPGGNLVEPWWNPVEPWWNPGGTLVEPWWNPGGTLVEPWWNPGGTLVELVEPWWNPGGTLVEPWSNPGLTLVEPWWNPTSGPPRTTLEPNSSLTASGFDGWLSWPQGPNAVTSLSGITPPTRRRATLLCPTQVATLDTEQESKSTEVHTHPRAFYLHIHKFVPVLQ